MLEERIRRVASPLNGLIKLTREQLTSEAKADPRR